MPARVAGASTGPGGHRPAGGPGVGGRPGHGAESAHGELHGGPVERAVNRALEVGAEVATATHHLVSAAEARLAAAGRLAAMADDPAVRAACLQTLSHLGDAATVYSHGIYILGDFDGNGAWRQYCATNRRYGRRRALCRAS